MRSSLTLVFAVCALAFVAGCGDKSKAGGTSEAAPPKSDVPEKFWVAQAPAGPKSVAAVKKDAKTGDEVTVVGRVGGAQKVFVDGIAAFTIVDEAAAACTKDHCETPWDYCCVDAKELTAQSVTVEFVDGDKPVKSNARGFHGLDYLSTVVVTGRVMRDDAGNVTVKATGLHVN